MPKSKADLVIHPIRLRILQILSRSPATTHMISNNLPDVPVSSLYRHLRLLLDEAFIEVSEARLVHGIEEKEYRLAQVPRLSQDDLVHLTSEEHIQYFTTYLFTLLEGFERYIGSSATFDYVKDRTGYTEVDFWASGVELDQLSQAINVEVQQLLENEPSEKRHLHKLAVITYPQRRKTD